MDGLDDPKGAKPRADEPIGAAVRRVRRRVQLLLFISGLLNGLAATALALGALLLALRLGAALAPTPTPLWTLAALPAFAYGWVRAVRGAPSEADCAMHLDRRLDLKGLLLAVHEEGAGPWAAQVQGALRHMREVLPRLDLWTLLGRVTAAGVFLTVVLVLPPPEDPSAPKGDAMASVLDELGQAVGALDRQLGITESTQAELEQRLAELRQAFERGAPPSWSDIDQLQQRLIDQLRSADEAAAAVEDITSRIAATLGGTDGRLDPSKLGALEPEMRALLDKVLEQSDGLGLLDQLDEGTKKKLKRRLKRKGEPMEGGDALTQEDLRRLQMLARQMRDRLGAPGSRELRRLAQLARAGSAPCDSPSSTAALAGLGAEWGITRGPGEAPMREGGTKEGETSELIELPRPDGRGGPSDLVGAGRTEAEVDVRRDTSAGREGVAEKDAVAGPRRRLSPRQREAVRRFFSEGTEGGSAPPAAGTSREGER